MARRMVGDGQDVYRVVVVRHGMMVNPDRKPGVYDPENSPGIIPSGKIETHAYGPYNSLGAAKGQLTNRTKDAYGDLLSGVVGGRIEKAVTSWERVPT